MNRLFISVALLIIFSNANCANILGIITMPSHSHYVLGFRILKELADRGHNVTAITAYSQKTIIKNYREIYIENMESSLKEFKKVLFESEQYGFVSFLKFVSEIGKLVSEKTLSNTEVQKLLQSKESFDLVLVGHFHNDAVLGMAYYLKAPLVVLSPISLTIFDNHLVPNPTYSSAIPNILSDLSNPMNFWDRMKNLIMDNVSALAIYLYVIKEQSKIFNKYISNETSLENVIYNVSLLLTNSHVSTNDPIPHVPNVIEIGGFHVNPTKNLSKDLKTFLDEGKEGVILFSMGSNLKSSDLKPELLDSILKVFSKLKQKVLWKFESEGLDTPKNVKIMKWLPQQEILAHPNVQAFISHGGLLSTIESVYFGVPIIGIPVFADQKNNIAAAVHDGYAICIPYQELFAEKISLAINEILKNPTYKKNVIRRSKIMHDQPMKPIDAAIYWIEYVLRHDGAYHLQFAATNLRWYQKNSLDVIIFLTTVTVILFIIFYVIIRKLLKSFNTRNENYKNKKNE